jgi:hypothetical protein
MKILFEVGDKVKVIKDGANASTIELSIERPKRGVYSLPNWKRCTFVISGDPIPIKFDFFPKIIEAYPLNYKGKLIGYVYNDALKFIK